MSRAFTRTFRVYHGGHRFDGPPRVLPLRSKHAETGPGINLTTHYETARKYAKGGGKVYLFELEADLGWTDRVRLPFARSFVGRVPRLHGRDRILADVERIEQRRGGAIFAENLVNLFVNSDNASGRTGLELAKWLSENGADATYSKQSGTEEWVVLLNPTKVVTWTPVDPKDPIDWELPRVRR